MSYFIFVSNRREIYTCMNVIIVSTTRGKLIDYTFCCSRLCSCCSYFVRFSLLLLLKNLHKIEEKYFKRILGLIYDILTPAHRNIIHLLQRLIISPHILSEPSGTKAPKTRLYISDICYLEKKCCNVLASRVSETNCSCSLLL